MCKLPKNHSWIKFYFKDWQLDLNLQSCSYGARGLWLEMIGLMTRSERYGYLQLNDSPLTVTQIANLTNGHKQYVIRYLKELEKKGVLSKNKNGVIFCRRMVDSVIDITTNNVIKSVTETVTENSVKSPKNQNPIYKNKSTEQEISSNDDTKFIGAKIKNNNSHFKAKTQGSRLPENWAPTGQEREYAQNLGLDVQRVVNDFCDYWHSKAGKDACKTNWSLTWQRWCRKARDWGKCNIRVFPAQPQQLQPRSSNLTWMVQQYEKQWGEVG